MKTLNRWLFGSWWHYDADDRLFRCDRFEITWRSRLKVALGLWWNGEDRRISLHFELPLLFSLFVKLPIESRRIRQPDSSEGPCWSWGFSMDMEAVHIDRGWSSRVRWWPWSDATGYECVDLWHRSISVFDPYTGKIVEAKIKGQQEGRRYWWGLRRKRSYCAWVDLAEETGPRTGSWKGGVLGFGVEMGRREPIPVVLQRVQQRMYGR